MESTKLRFDLEPIELFNLDTVIGEQHPLPNTPAAWGAVVANITAARAFEDGCESARPTRARL